MSFKLVCEHLKKLTPNELEKLKLILSGVVKPFYCKTKRCDKTKTKQCDECALQELNDMQ